ncbi:MAG TPA: lysine--tRNA ligase [Patescibacteria group bacterium]
MTNQPQSHHWLDKVATGILKWQEKNTIEQLHVDDMKTPSGRVHTGALRGVLLHDLVAKVLKTKTDQPVVSTYVFNDMDSMDGLPAYLDKSVYEQHMGKPLYKIPKPELSECGINLEKATEEELADFAKAKNFAELYAFDFLHAFRKLGCSQEIVWSHDLYESGQMDETIRTVLNKVDVLKKIYRQVAEYELPEKWFPFQVICPNCGKVGTTLVTDWDGEQVTYECQPNKVTWAKGCGHSGKVSPFGGTGKLLWKVDWPAHWAVMGVNVEGAGKDHTSAGGSRDMANAMCQPVFNIPVPFDIPYEWILIRGAKMSSSKGVGTSAREFTELFPAEVGRFLFVNKHYGQVIDFDPATMAIPDLFDEYDHSARIFWGEDEGDQRFGRSFELSQVGEVPTQYFLPRFRDVATWMQHPELNLVEKFEEVKGGSLTARELAELELRQHYAQIWLDRYALEEFQLTPKTEMPEKAKELSEEQKKFLAEMNTLIDSQDWKPEELQQALFDLAKSTIGAKQGFQAIYLAFLGKTAGPRAAWFLLSIDKEQREKRITELNR